MTEALANMSGPQRAAIFLLGVGETCAASIMKHMAPKEVQLVGEAMACLEDVTNEQLASVVQDFSDRVSQVNPIGIGTGDFTRRVMVEALGENRAHNMLSKVMKGSSSKGLEALKWMDARSVAAVIKDEHPQIMALVLASLDGEHAARVMDLLNAETRSDVILRIARLDLVDPTALLELDQVLEKQLSKGQESPPASVDGMNAAAGILGHMESDAETEMLDSVKAVDGELGEKIQELMFVFENLMVLDDRGMQRLIREISVDSLVIALKGVDTKVQNKFFDNMSSRAADMLREDLEAKGPVKLSDVEAQQKDILTIATRLAEEGEIFLGKGGGDFV